jgi:energy-coupling factor transporter ATP-binding protein EcfA2
VTREHQHSAPATPDGGTAANNLPVPVTRIVGRDNVVAALATQLAQRRLLTIVGPSGIGKTTVAVAVAEAVTPDYTNGVRFVSLAPLMFERYADDAICHCRDEDQATALRTALATRFAECGLTLHPEPDLVPSTVSTVLGIAQSGTNPISGLTAWLRDKHA